MTKKAVFVATALLLLAGLSLYVNRQRFQSAPLLVGSRSMPARGPFQQQQEQRQRQRQRQNQLPENSAVDTLVFLMSREDRLKSVKVIPLSDIQTNKYPHPIWELTSDSNSVPVKDFVYGRNIRGMRPSVKGAQPEPLVPGIGYRLYVVAHSGKAEHDFVPVPRTR